MQARWAASIIHQKKEPLIAQHQIRTSTGGVQPGPGLLQPGSYHGLLDPGLVQGPENFNKWALLERSSGGEVINIFTGLLKREAVQAKGESDLLHSPAEDFLPL